MTNIRYAMMLMWGMNMTRGEGGGECRKKSESLRASYQVYPTPQKYVKIDLLGIKDRNNLKTWRMQKLNSDQLKKWAVSSKSIAYTCFFHVSFEIDLWKILLINCRLCYVQHKLLRHFEPALSDLLNTGFRINFDSVPASSNTVSLFQYQNRKCRDLQFQK